MLDPSLDPGYGRLSITCELPRRAIHRTLWAGTVPVVSIDGADQLGMTWGSTQFDLPIGTHHLRIEVRPGQFALDFKPIERTVEITSQWVHQLRYEAPAVPGFPPRLVDL